MEAPITAPSLQRLKRGAWENSTESMVEVAVLRAAAKEAAGDAVEAWLASGSREKADRSGPKRKERKRPVVPLIMEVRMNDDYSSLSGANKLSPNEASLTLLLALLRMLPTSVLTRFSLRFKLGVKSLRSGAVRKNAFLAVRIDWRSPG